MHVSMVTMRRRIPEYVYRRFARQSPDQNKRMTRCGPAARTYKEKGLSVLGAFKLDHLQHIKLILFQKISIILSFILGSLIIYYPRAIGRRGI